MPDKTETLKEIERHQLVAVIRTPTAEEAYQAARACLRGGARLIEITFSVPGAEDVIARLKAEIESGSLEDARDVTLGAGSVLSTEDAEKALKAGARYIVSPHLDEEIVGFTNGAGLLSVAGAATPTEIVRAHRAGADIVKLFPFVEMGGLKYLKTIRGPLPFIRYMPSGGVTLDNVSEYLEARVSGIIVGSALTPPEALAAHDWDAIAERAALFVAKIELSREG